MLLPLLWEKLQIINFTFFVVCSIKVYVKTTGLFNTNETSKHRIKDFLGEHFNSVCQSQTTDLQEDWFRIFLKRQTDQRWCAFIKHLLLKTSKTSIECFSSSHKNLFFRNCPLLLCILTSFWVKRAPKSFFSDIAALQRLK